VDTALPASVDEAGALRIGWGCVVPHPRTLLRPPPPPSRPWTTSRGSPVIGPHAPSHRTARAGEGFPSSCIHRCTVPLPIPRRVLRRCASRIFAPSMAFAVTHPARLPLVPPSRVLSRGGRIRVMLRTGTLLPQKGFRRCASTPGVSPRRRQPATGLPGDYPDRTFTGWQMQAYGHRSHQVMRQHSLPDIACALWARCGSTNTRVPKTHSPGDLDINAPEAAVPSKNRFIDLPARASLSQLRVRYYECADCEEHFATQETYCWLATKVIRSQ